MDKRASLRQHFEDKDYQKKLDQQHKDQLQKMDSLENTLVKSIDAFIRFINGNISKTEVINQIKSVSTPDVDRVTQAIKKLDEHVLSQKLDLKPLENSMNGIKRELSLIPKSHQKLPEAKDSFKVTNLDEIKLDTKPVEDAIKGLKLVAEAPIINTEQIDLKPLQDIMLDLIKSVKDQKYPETKIPKFPITDLSKVEKKLDESNKHLKKIVDKPVGGSGGGGSGVSFQNSSGNQVRATLNPDGSIPISSPTYKLLLDDTSTANVTYVGKAAIGSATSASVWQIQKIDETSGMVITWGGTGAFDQEWDERAGTVVYA